MKRKEFIINKEHGDSYLRLSKDNTIEIKSVISDPKTAFLTELKVLMERYNVTIDVEGDECSLSLIIDIDGHEIEYNAYDYFIGKEKQTALTSDNIFNYDKE